jgi:hypothetical protein
MTTEYKCPNCGAALTIRIGKCEYCGSLLETEIEEEEITESPAEPQDIVEKPEKPKANSLLANLLSLIIGLIVTYYSYRYIKLNLQTNAILLILAAPIAVTFLTIPLASWFKQYKGLVFIFMGLMIIPVFLVSFMPLIKDRYGMSSIAVFIVALFSFFGLVMIKIGINSLSALNKRKKQIK